MNGVTDGYMEWLELAWYDDDDPEADAMDAEAALDGDDDGDFADEEPTDEEWYAELEQGYWRGVRGGR